MLLNPFFTGRIWAFALLSTLLFLAGSNNMSLAASGSHADLRPQSLALGAFYYPWYDKDQWAHVAHTNEPLRGLYKSADPSLVRAHLADCEKAGITFLLYSWWGRDKREDAVLRQSFLSAIVPSPINFAILYETAGALSLEAGKSLDFAVPLPGNPTKTTGDRFVEDVDYLARTCFGHPRYQKIGGKPALYVYLVRDMRNSEPYVAKARENCRKIGFDLYLIADLVYLAPAEQLPWPAVAAGYDAVTGYNMYFQGMQADEYLDAVQAKFEEYRQSAERHGLAFIPNVQPGYDDRKLRGEDRMDAPREDGAFYRNYWAIAERHLDGQWPLLLLTSFNEWHEGTEIEPSREYGDFYLLLTRELLEETKASLRHSRKRQR